MTPEEQRAGAAVRGVESEASMKFWQCDGCGLEEDCKPGDWEQINGRRVWRCNEKGELVRCAKCGDIMLQMEVRPVTFDKGASHADR